MKNAHFNTFYRNALILFFLFFLHTSYAQSFCKVLEEEYNLSEITKAGDEYLILSSHGSIFRSMDGTNWVEDEIDEFDDVESFGIPSAMAFFNDKMGLVASFSNPDASKSSFYHTEDGGLTWTRSKLMLEDGSTVGFFPLQLFALDEETVVMTQKFSSKLFISYDRGYTWSFTDDYTQTAGALMDIRFIDKDVWYLPTHEGLYKTYDQLESAELLTELNFIEFYTSSDSPKLYGVTYGFGSIIDLYFSDDEFSTSVKISLNEAIPNLSFVSFILKVDDMLYIIEGDRMHYSTDDGQSWTQTNLENADRHNLRITHIDDEIYSHRGEILKFNCMPLGTEENNIENAFSVYPNPTDGRLDIKNPNHLDLYFTLFDLSGKKLIENRSSNSVNLSEFDNGVYFMHIDNRENNERVIERIVLIK